MPRLGSFIIRFNLVSSDLLFITLRDETGIVQLISEEVDKYIDINRESTVTITGIVQKRTDDMINPNMKTGEIEINILRINSNRQIYDIPNQELKLLVNHLNSSGEELYRGILEYFGYEVLTEKEIDNIKKKRFN